MRVEELNTSFSTYMIIINHNLPRARHTMRHRDILLSLKDNSKLLKAFAINFIDFTTKFGTNFRTQMRDKWRQTEPYNSEKRGPGSIKLPI